MSLENRHFVGNFLIKLGIAMAMNFQCFDGTPMQLSSNMATYGKGEAPSFIAKACKNLDNQIDNYIDRQMDRYVDELELDYI